MAAIEIMRLKHIIILQNKVDLIKDDAAEKQHQQILEFVKGAYWPSRRPAPPRAP